MTPPEWVELLLVHIQTKVAMVMKCRSEMLASKLFWMYLQGTVSYENLGFGPKWFGSAPPIEFDASCAYPKKDKPEYQG